MALHTSRIVDLETQMAEVRVQINTQHQDLKEAISALAASTKDNINALAASITCRWEKSSVQSPPRADAGTFDEPQHFRHQQRHS
ncbi:unnamed protein product [Linum trigynum]|uniref:Uncharacterized protein n=1 Tax=Linum trigynum TaxID=586398 RepID=A0AAV2E0B3_9ROSI